jgi:hypothetical protein
MSFLFKYARLLARWVTMWLSCQVTRQKMVVHLFLALTVSYHSRFIPEGVAEASKIFLRDVLPKLLAMWNTADVTDGKPIAVLLQSLSGVSAINPLVAFYDIHGGRERCYSFILSRTPHETRQYHKSFIHHHYKW